MTARRLLTALGLAIALIVAAAATYARVRDPERAELDDAARASLPGRLVATPLGWTYVLTEGSDTGRTVVLVHGMSVPSYIWDTTAHRLAARGWRVIRYDLIGRGWSDRPDIAYDGAAYDTQLQGVLDGLRIAGPVDLMGLSFGGYVTAHYAASHPARVRTLTLLDPVAAARPGPAVLNWPIIGDWMWRAMITPRMADGQPGDFLHPERHPDWVARYRPQQQYVGFGRAIRRTRETMVATDFDALYAAVGRTGIPVLLLWGRQDATVPIKLAQVVKRGIPQATFVPVDSAGHLPAMEQPDAVQAAFDAFFAAHPAAAPAPAHR